MPNFSLPFTLPLTENPVPYACIAGLGLTYHFPHQVCNFVIKLSDCLWTLRLLSLLLTNEHFGSWSARFPFRGGLSPSPSEAGLCSQTHRQAIAWCLLSGALSCCETIPLGSRRFHPNSAGPGSARRWAMGCFGALCTGALHRLLLSVCFCPK